MVDGEGMERLWSYLRRFASMTKEMTLPNRQDLLTCALLNFARRNVGTIGKKTIDITIIFKCINTFYRFRTSEKTLIIAHKK